MVGLVKGHEARYIKNRMKDTLMKSVSAPVHVEKVDNSIRVCSITDFQTELEQQRIDGKDWIIDPDGEHYFYSGFKSEEGTFQATWDI
jgi:hypothetical protein